MVSRRTCGIGSVIGIGLAVAGLGLAAVLAAPADPPAAQPNAYRSPYDLAWSPDGKLLAVSDRTAGVLLFVDPAGQRIKQEVPVGGKPGGVAWATDSSKVYIADYQRGAITEVSAEGKVLRKMVTGPHPNGIALVPGKGLLLCTNMALGDLSVIDLTGGKEKSRIKVLRDPFAVAVTPDESLAVVSNLLPVGAASNPRITSAISLIDLGSLQKIADINLPPNSTSVRQVAISADGAWAYTVHTVGRTTLPATQLERGWVNTNALSIIDLKNKKLEATLLMDTLSEGAADPWGIALARDGGRMWVTLAGVHQLARIELASLHQNLNAAPATKPGAAPAPVGKGAARAAPPPANNLWAQIKADPAKKAELVNDLAALYASGLIARPNLPGKGPRGLGLSPDGKQIAVGMYYSGKVLLIDGETSKVTATIALGPDRQPDEARKGEIIFHDSSYAFQHWISCATCHPNEGRVDGLNWDLMNDGLGNPKNAKSLLLAHKTPPAMWLGVRDTMETAAMAGFRFAAHQPHDDDVKAVQAYIRSLTPEPSPYRAANGALSEKAKRGKAIFNDEKTACAHCHSGELGTNLKRINVGTQGEFDHKDEDSFVTPPLIELWRTAPYLHDGRAATLQDMLTRHNPGDKHGKTSHLSKDEVDALVEYLLSL